MRLLVLCVLAVALAGCSRAYYRRQADQATYQAIDERDHDPRWALPRISIDTPPASRLHDPFNPDHPPLPPDDPTAHRYMHLADGHPGYRHWHKDGDAPWIEDPAWRDSLDLDAAGSLRLTPDRAVELGLLDSREYQTQLETVYLNALALTLDRFEFALHWFATNTTTFTHFGSSADELNTLTTTSDAGFTKAFTAGGQLMVEFANSFIFQFAGPDKTAAPSNIIVNLMQPVLRGFGRQVRMEVLTEAERNLLYAVRDFARFRKQYTFDVATNRYLSLLFQEQNIRNLRANLASLQQNYQLHQALYIAGIVSSVKVDQVLQDLQTTQLGLIQAEASLETSLDSYKNLLGLPPDIPLRLDDALLAPFELNDPAVTRHQEAVDAFQAEYRELNAAPPLARLREGFRRLREFHTRTLELVGQVDQELEKWRKLPPEADQTKERAAQEQLARQTQAKDLEDLRADLRRLDKSMAAAAAGLAEKRRAEGWQALQLRAREEGAAAAQLFVIQTQIRVYLIRLTPVRYGLDEATATARDNRLDLMNQRGKVVDAWRQIAVTASFLEAGLDLMLSANIANPPLSANPVDFRASASTYSVGFRFDSPLNRVAERNTYRASLMSYQQARRAFMALEDQVERQVRLDLRQLRTERLNFDIQRQRLITAARQLEAAREELLTSDRPDPTSTQNILNALNAVLTAKNGLIGSWVNYETVRIQLLLDMDVLQLDDRGLYTDGTPDDRAEPPAGTGAAPPGRPAGGAGP